MTAVVPGGATTGKVVVTTPSGALTSNVNFRNEVVVRGGRAEVTATQFAKRIFAMSERFVSIFASAWALFLTSLLLPRSATPQQIVAGAFVTSSMTVRVAADQQMTGTSLTAISGLSWSLPSLPAVQAYSFHCAGSYQQGTVATDQFGL